MWVSLLICFWRKTKVLDVLYTLINYSNSSMIGFIALLISLWEELFLKIYFIYIQIYLFSSISQHVKRSGKNEPKITNCWEDVKVFQRIGLFPQTTSVRASKGNWNVIKFQTNPEGEIFHRKIWWRALAQKSQDEIDSISI